MRKPACFILFFCLLVVPLIADFAPAKAEAENYTITVPDDFPTINQALQNATDGATIFVRMGTYNETLVIDKAITLRGEDTNRTVLNGNGTGTVIQILHSNVTVTGFKIAYSTTPNSPRRYYQHDLPSGWMKQGDWSAIGYPLDGGYFVRRTDFKLYGVHVMNAKNCTVTGNVIADCGVGIWLWESSQNNITGNLLTRNDYGLLVDHSANNRVIGNTFQSNGGGVWLPQPNWAPGWALDRKTVNNTFTQNNFINNLWAVEPQSITNTTNYWDNGSVGNYWGGFNGTDGNGDGIADEPYHIMGDYYSGGYKQYGVWTEQLYRVDTCPLMEPFNTSSMFIVHVNEGSGDAESTGNPADYTTVEVAASVAGVAAIVLLVVYFKRHREPF